MNETHCYFSLTLKFKNPFCSNNTLPILADLRPKRLFERHSSQLHLHSLSQIRVSILFSILEIF
jgi:hypothetical protein